MKLNLLEIYELTLDNTEITNINTTINIIDNITAHLNTMNFTQISEDDKEIIHKLIAKVENLRINLNY